MALDLNEQGASARNGGVGQFVTSPLYQQVAAAVQRRVALGEWSRGLPNEHDLSSEFGVSTGTVRKALDMLEDRGVLVRIQGQGTFVRDLEPWERLPASAAAVLQFVAGNWRPAADPAKRNLVQYDDAGEETGPALTADEFRIIAEGANEIAAWLDQRALLLAREAAA